MPTTKAAVVGCVLYVLILAISLGTFFMLKSLHPALQLIATQPQLVFDHLGIYVEWLSDEVSRASVRWRWRLILWVLAVLCVGMAFVLGGVALMLWATVPLNSAAPTWVLWVTPLFPLLVSVVCVVVLLSGSRESLIEQLKLQFREDVSVFLEAKAP